MIKVNNSPAVARLARKSLFAGRTRNCVAVAAIALTTMLFTALFTIALTLANTFEQQTARQMGGDMSGAFKDVSLEQLNELKTDPLIREYGARLILGMPMNPPFNKAHVEISYMDPNCAKHSFCVPEIGRLPAENTADNTKELACDSYILQLLGITPELGAQVTLPYQLGDGTKGADTFTLVGWWTHDDAGVASMALVSRSYVEEKLVGYEPLPFDTTGRWTLNVNLKSNAHIEEDMRRILARHGYQCDDRSAEDFIAIGVSWVSLVNAVNAGGDPITALSLHSILSVIVLTGYLIIYNVFQISVSNDIRFYGLLKTIGTTPRQLRSIVRRQALALCATGIPLGLALGYGLGLWLAPATLNMLSTSKLYFSASPAIFVGAALFSLVTVLFSCARPGRLAGRVSPIEAVRYTEGSPQPKNARRRATSGGNPLGMALANLSRSGKKTALVVFSLSLAAGLMQVTYSFVNGFDMDKYLRIFVATDFVLGDAGYFQSHSQNTMTQTDIDAVNATGFVREGGAIHAWYSASAFVPEQFYRDRYAGILPEQDIDTALAAEQRDGRGYVSNDTSLYGMGDFALGKLHVLAGDLTPLYALAGNAAAYVCSEGEDGGISPRYSAAKLGDTITVQYVERWEYYDTATGQVVDDPESVPSAGSRPKVWRNVDYTVTALVSVPQPLSFRYSGGAQFVLNREVLARDAGEEPFLLNYAFDTALEDNAAMEAFLQEYTENAMPNLDYESKASYTAQFDQLRGMFLLLGGVLSAVVAVVGVLNFLNAMLTSILARRREFAVLQAVGMTDRQLKALLMWEGVLYAALAAAASLLLCLLVSAAMQRVVGEILWFFTYRFSLLPLAVVTPCFFLLGALLPLGMLRVITRQTVVERLRAVE